MNGVNSFQHIFPIALPFQWINVFFLFQPAIEIDISTLHYHVDMVISNLTKTKVNVKIQGSFFVSSSIDLIKYEFTH